VFVHAVVIHDWVDIRIDWYGVVNGAQEFLMPVLGLAPSKHRTVEVIVMSTKQNE
jgi:hypothetical protein